MTNDQRKYRFIFQLIFTPAIAFMSYFMVAIIIGPLLIDIVGEIYTKVFITALTIIIILIYLLYIYNLKLIEANGNKNNCVNDRNNFYHRKLLISLSILSFVMVPFGFAGMLVIRGEATFLLRLFGGSVCLASGIFLLYSYLKDRE